MLFHRRGACVHEVHVRVRSTCIPASTCFYEYRGKRNIITKNGCHVYTFTCHHPSSLVSRSFWAGRPKKFVAHGTFRTFFLPSFYRPSVPTLYLHRVYRRPTRLSWLDSRIIHSRGSKRSSGVVQPVTSRIYE